MTPRDSREGHGPGKGHGSGAARRDYDRRAAGYDARWDWYVEATTAETLARLSVEPGDRILDVGLGTGRLLERLEGGRPAPRSLTGVDVSEGMLEVARRRLPRDVRLVQGDAAALPFAGASFELAVSTSAMHFWPRPLDALREIRRVLAPRGRLVLTDWCRDFWGPRLREIPLRLLDRAHHRTWSGSELGEALETAGFRVEALDRYRIRPTWGMMTARAVRVGVG